MLLADLLISSLFHIPPVAADMATTEYALTRPDLRERGIQDREARIGANLAIALCLTYVDHKLGQKKQKKLQWALRIGHLALAAWVVQHNWDEIQGSKQREKMYGTR